MRRSIPQGCAERIVRRGSCHHAVCLLFVGALLHRDAGVYVVALFVGCMALLILSGDVPPAVEIRGRLN